MRRRVVVVLATGLAAVVLAGCNRFGYEAHIDSAEAAPGSPYVVASGWVRDVVHDRRPGDAPVVRWQVDGATSASGVPATVEFGTRPDVDAALGPLAAAIPRSSVAQGLTRGTHRLCVDAVPADATATPFVALDCTLVDVPFDQFDHSALDVVEVAGTTVTAAGWYSHLILTLTDLMSQPWFAIDGVVVASPAVVTTVDRPDAVVVYGPTAKGVTLQATVAPGAHQLCIGLSRPFTTDLTGTTSCRSFTVS